MEIVKATFDKFFRCMAHLGYDFLIPISVQPNVFGILNYELC